MSGEISPVRVREGGLEPPRPCGHWHLKPARLPFRHSRSIRPVAHPNQPKKASTPPGRPPPDETPTNAALPRRAARGARRLVQTAAADTLYVDPAKRKEGRGNLR